MAKTRISAFHQSASSAVPNSGKRAIFLFVADLVDGQGAGLLIDALHLAVGLHLGDDLVDEVEQVLLALGNGMATPPSSTGTS